VVLTGQDEGFAVPGQAMLSWTWIMPGWQPFCCNRLIDMAAASNASGKNSKMTTLLFSQETLQ